MQYNSVRLFLLVVVVDLTPHGVSTAPCCYKVLVLLASKYIVDLSSDHFGINSYTFDTIHILVSTVEQHTQQGGRLTHSTSEHDY